MKYELNEGLKRLYDSYDIDFDAIIDSIKAKGYNKVAVQLPDGFKLHSLEISDFIRENSGAEVFIWGGSTYGACDVPLGLERLGVKMIIQLGHAKYRADQTQKPLEIK
jgi:diphthamide biosynthesis enzyme Dph1/Dph2-like protein